MAAQENTQDVQELIKYKKCVLKVSIHCEGCKKKVKKILNQVPGVYEIDFDIKQHKVTVTGDVDAQTLLRKLIKSGKNAELWPEKAEPKEKKTTEKPKQKEKLTQQESNDQAPSQEIVKNIKNDTVKEIKPPPEKVEAVAQELPTKNSTGDGAKAAHGGRDSAAKSGQENGGGEAVDEAGKKIDEAGKKTESGGDQAVKELKTEEKKPEREETVGENPPVAGVVAAEKKGGESSPVVGGGNEVGHNGKKKKKKGHNRNLTIGEQSSAAQEEMRSRNHEDGPPAASVPDHHSHTRHQSYDQYAPHFYGPPPTYAVSYNTANPTISHTASYYAPSPPNSYVYSYPGAPELQPPLSDFDPYSRQPLDSFEMFSDENPNGCSIM